MHEKGKFPAQPQPNPQTQGNKGAGGSGVKFGHEQVQSITTLRSGKMIEKPDFVRSDSRDDSTSKLGGKDGVDDVVENFSPNLEFRGDKLDEVKNEIGEEERVEKNDESDEKKMKKIEG
ncbi:hypothetical protein, partial [Bartonella sp. AC134YNZD]|uniref:hypothetical protein n=1 Tax=Bartonella sp. AC134YNZD TaxID=3243446 RepID=UPI0035CFCCAD